MRQLISKRVLLLTAFCMLLTLTFTPVSLVAAETSSDIQHVYDDAGLLSTSELSDLEAMCTQYSTEDNVDIIILTHNDANAVDKETYIENFYDSTLTGNSVILLLDMSTRDVFIEGYGTAENSINSNRINTIIEKITSYLTSGDYYNGLKQYIELADKYINTVPIYENTWVHLIVAVIMGAVIVIVMAFNAGGKMTANGATYMDSSDSGLIGRRDDYIRTQITRIRKPQNNGSGGGGGVSAGGSSHSSGGGKF